jgi:hypothetical protein
MQHLYELQGESKTQAKSFVLAAVNRNMDTRAKPKRWYRYVVSEGSSHSFE